MECLQACHRSHSHLTLQGRCLVARGLDLDVLPKLTLLDNLEPAGAVWTVTCSGMETLHGSAARGHGSGGHGSGMGGCNRVCLLSPWARLGLGLISPSHGHLCEPRRGHQRLSRCIQVSA